MTAGKRMLGLITARGGSKGVPGKNVRVVGGRPLIAWTVAAARAATCLDRVVVSTDDEQIAAAARAAGAEVPFQRPAHLATDEARSIDVVLHAWEALPGYDALVLLQPTSPLRSAADIDAAVTLWADSGAASCVSVTEVDQHPDWMYRLDSSLRLQPLNGGAVASRRQDLPPVYALNGAIYVVDGAWLRSQRRLIAPDAVGYIMPAARSLDIDTELDFQLLNCIIGETAHE